MIDKAQIRHNFSRYASRYDAYAAVQTQVGKVLSDYCPDRDVKRILELGCGTGIFTQCLRERYDTASITAVDLCEDMIDVARQKPGGDQIHYRIGDAEALDVMPSFDLVASNACFQWFANIEKTLQGFRDRLSSPGSLVFSVFGPGTLCELVDSLSRLHGRTITISSEIFLDHRIYECLLRRFFDRVTVECQLMECTYGSLWDLLKTIKYTGARGMGLANLRLSRREIEALEKIYLATYGRIVATYDVVYCKAEG